MIGDAAEESRQRCHAGGRPPQAARRGTPHLPGSLPEGLASRAGPRVGRSTAPTNKRARENETCCSTRTRKPRRSARSRSSRAPRGPSCCSPAWACSRSSIATCSTWPTSSCAIRTSIPRATIRRSSCTPPRTSPTAACGGSPRVRSPIAWCASSRRTACGGSARGPRSSPRRAERSTCRSSSTGCCAGRSRARGHRARAQRGVVAFMLYALWTRRAAARRAAGLTFVAAALAAG